MNMVPSGSFAKGTAVITCTLSVSANSVTDINFDHTLP